MAASVRNTVPVTVPRLVWAWAASASARTATILSLVVVPPMVS
jgi:hypothetical protein